MILLVTSSERGSELAVAIEAATGETLVVAESLVQATMRLRESSYLALVLDQHLAESEPRETDTMLHHLGTAVLVQVNLGISGQDRLVREVRSALRHRQHEVALARRTTKNKLSSELNGTLTALLLTVELAIETEAVSAAAGEKLQSIHGLVKELRRQLDSESMNENFETAGAARA
jgi:hypothetical protein